MDISKNKIIFIFLISFLIFVGLSFSVFAQEDTEAPVTTKTYGEPNEEGLISVPVCEGDPVPVNGHFITTSTAITLDATDDIAGVDFTSVKILVPGGCEGEHVQYVGFEDDNIYEVLEVCELAVDDPETQEVETQQCVQTRWISDRKSVV